MTRLDDWLPVYEFSERHEKLARAPEPAVRRALDALEPGRIPLIRLLMALRALPALVSAPRAALAERRRSLAEPRQRGLLALPGSVLLADEPREIVLGLTGRFWRASAELLPTRAETFREPPPPGSARAATNVLLAPRPDGATLVSTETRVHCADEAARRAFAWYWRAIRLGSGAIRRAMLRAIVRAAEQRGAAR